MGDAVAVGVMVGECDLRLRIAVHRGLFGLFDGGQVAVVGVFCAGLGGGCRPLPFCCDCRVADDAFATRVETGEFGLRLRMAAHRRLFQPVEGEGVLAVAADA